MSDGTSSSRQQAGGSVPERPIVQATAKAIEQFFVAALAELETKMKDALQTKPDAGPLNGPLQLLTEQMTRELSENVRRVLRTTAPPDFGAGDTTGS
ncbi:MAG: hypothetical protein ABSA90_11320 [Xanthobacteraceae bacterium]|jgi:hypothetical protein